MASEETTVQDAAAGRRSPLHRLHAEAGARFVDFGGWEMPVQYEGIAAEHRAVRAGAGIFDISHMGEFFVRGPAAERWLNGLLTNDASKLDPGESQYTLLLNEQGGVIDDLILYRLAPDEFLMVVNAARTEEDRAWMEAHLSGEEVEFSDRSAEFFGIALQGPNAVAIAAAAFPDGVDRLPERGGIAVLPWQGRDLIIAGTGYTGEPGLEFFGPVELAEAFWTGLQLAAEKTAQDLARCGLGARDSLRLEAGLPLNGSDLNAETTPLEAGLRFFVKLEKPEDFPGKAVLRSQHENGVPRRLVCIQLNGKTPPPRAHYGIFVDGKQVSELTSGGLSPSLSVGIGLAYLPPEMAEIGTSLEVDIRGRRYEAQVVKRPFYRSPSLAASL